MIDLPPDSSEPKPTDKIGGFAKLSTKIAGRTTDLIGVAILTIGLFAVGGKIGRWWHTDPHEVNVPQGSLPSIEPWDTAGAGVSLEWGDLNYAIHHQTLSGDAAAAGERLEEIAVAKFAQVTGPDILPTEAEKKLLAELQDVPPTRSLERGGRLYRFGPQLPMVILTQAATSSLPSGHSETRRVVCWGRAFPQAPQQWMAFLFYAAEGPASGRTNEWVIPLPDGCRKLQRMRDASGQSWTAFRGRSSLGEAKRHFDHWFQDHDWQVQRGWSETGSGWTARFHSREASQTADLWLNPSANGAWEGMLFLSPRSSARAEN